MNGATTQSFVNSVWHQLRWRGSLQPSVTQRAPVDHSKGRYAVDGEVGDVTHKTLIAVLVDPDDHETSRMFVELLDGLAGSPDAALLRGYHFVVTREIYDMAFLGRPMCGQSPLSARHAAFVERECGLTILPRLQDGGATLLARLVSKGECRIVWALCSTYGGTWLGPEYQAIMRLCDQSKAKRLVNRTSILTWLRYEARDDWNLNPQPVPKAPLPAGLRNPWVTALGAIRRPFVSVRTARARSTGPREAAGGERSFRDMTVALIAHDEMKSRLIEFATEFERDLYGFARILATGTTGGLIAAASDALAEKVERCNSGPKGGDVEIAAEVLLGHCDIVIFFVDPLSPHPHLDDIRVVFQACMVSNHAILITNETSAREFMQRVVRGRQDLTLATVS